MPDNVMPFLKWAGGKRWFVNQYSHLFPKNFNRYIEPFLGSGSVFFSIKPPNALLGDSNSDLIAAYQGIKANWRDVNALLQEHQNKHSDIYYYYIRKQEPQDLIERAARIIYLNRTCFNGIYRVNRSGKFNVPRGTRNNVLRERDDFESLSNLLQDQLIINDDFESLINQACMGDFIFADPPYTVRHNNNGFVKYNEKLFSWDDQERLANALTRARARGAIIVSTNANHDSVRELYNEEHFQFTCISRYSSISATGNNRRKFDELVIISKS